MAIDMLNLPGLSVVSKNETDNEFDEHIRARVSLPTSSCTYCNSLNIRNFGKREQVIRDIPIRSKRVAIYVTTQRFQCTDCSVTFYERIPNIDGKRRMTHRLVDWIGKNAIHKTFSCIAAETGLTEGTIRSVFADYIVEKEKNISFQVPEYMGIDEIKLKNTHCVITNIKNNTLIDILKDRKEISIIKYLEKSASSKPVKAVSMDMWNPYRQAVQKALPKAEIVIDKFHVVRMANDGLISYKNAYTHKHSVRTLSGLPNSTFTLLRRKRDLNEEQFCKLQTWFKSHRELEHAYQVKERFFDIYEASNAEEAKILFRNWFADLTPELKKANSNLINAWQNWEPYICNYFNHRITNAYTESINNLIRLVDRIGRGYSFNVLRAKMLLAKSAYKIEKPPKFIKLKSKTDFTSVGYSTLFDDLDFTDGHETENDKTINYGVDIDLFIQMLERNEMKS